MPRLLPGSSPLVRLRSWLLGLLLLTGVPAYTAQAQTPTTVRDQLVQTVRTAEQSYEAAGTDAAKLALVEAMAALSAHDTGAGQPAGLSVDPNAAMIPVVTAEYTAYGSDDPGGPATAFTSIATPGNRLALNDEGGGLNPDDDFTTVALGFSFPFYGESYASMPVSANGYLNPSGDDPDDFSESCPLTDFSSSPGDVIAPLWSDWDPDLGWEPGGYGSVHAESFAECPTGSYSAGQCFVAEWNNVHMWVKSGSFTFQVILYPDGTMEFQYGGREGTDTSGFATGVRDNPYSLTYACDPGSVTIPAPFAVRIVPGEDNDSDDDGIVDTEDGDVGNDGRLDLKDAAAGLMSEASDICPAPASYRADAVVAWIEASMNPLLWVSASRYEPDEDLGRDVFDAEFAAAAEAEELLAILGNLEAEGCRATVANALALLVEADRLIASAAVDRAGAACLAGECLVPLALAEALLADGDAWAAGPSPTQAINKYGNAWEQAMAVLDLIVTPDAPGGAGIEQTGALGAGSVATSLESLGVPTEFVLSPNYPNPFNPATTLRFGLPEGAHVTLTVHDVMGREVARVLGGFFAAGYHEARFDAGSLPSGVYLYRLATPATALTGRMMLVK